MTLPLSRALLLWVGALALALLAIVPLAAGWRVVVVFSVACFLILTWRRTRRRAALQAQSLMLAEGKSLPPADYRQPVVLVCGDGLVGLFGATPAEQLAIRITEQGCYLRVPDFEQLPVLTESLLSLRPDWGGQLSVMFIVNPDEHSDGPELAGRVRAFCYQLALVRKRRIAMPLLLVSYLQALRGDGPWFSWEAGQASPNVRDGGACVSLDEWQRQSADGATQAARLQTCVQLNSFVEWLGKEALPHFQRHDTHRSAGLALSFAVTLVPVLPQRVATNLWQQWLRDKVALPVARHALVEADTVLPFPDPLLHLLPTHIQNTPLRRASVAALWLFALSGLIAMTSSTWQNNLLLRQVSDDLRRYTSVPEASRRDQPEFAQQEEAISVLRQDAERLDSYYRQGEPLSLGLGLYHGERLRAPVLAAIANYRQPPASPTPSKIPKPVRLDSLSLFSVGSARLKPESAKMLINALVDIKAQPGWLIVIAGHTDATGNPEHNLLLSRARAAAVRDWIQRMGDIPDSCFAVQGFGAGQPIESNDTENGRMANRRVDIRLVPEVGACVLPTAGLDRKPLSQLATFN